MARPLRSRTPWDVPPPPPSIADAIPPIVGLGILHTALRGGQGDVAELFKEASFETVPAASAEVLAKWPAIDAKPEAARKDCARILPGRALRGNKESSDARLWQRPLLIPAKTSPGFKDPLAEAKAWTRRARREKAKKAAAAAAAVAAALRPVLPAKPAAAREQPERSEPASPAEEDDRRGLGDWQEELLDLLEAVAAGTSTAPTAAPEPEPAAQQPPAATSAPAPPEPQSAASTALASQAPAPPEPLPAARTLRESQAEVPTPRVRFQEVPTTLEPEQATAQPPAEPVPLAPTVGLLFPDQGSHSVGMTAELASLPAVQEYAEIAKQVLGYDLLKICVEGPLDVLEETSVCQPAVYFASLAALERFKEQSPQEATSPGAVAGLSLGEFAALCAAGVYTFEEGLRLVKVRADAMAEASRTKPQAMLSVAGLELDYVRMLCAELDEAKGEVCKIANVLFPRAFMCAGTQKAIKQLRSAVREDGALQVRIIDTRGAFHTELMLPARERLEAALEELRPKLCPPKCDVYMNCTGECVPRGSDPSLILPLLAEQMCTTVEWEESLRRMIKDGVKDFIEVGPMKQMQMMVKKIDPAVWKSMRNVTA